MVCQLVADLGDRLFINVDQQKLDDKPLYRQSRIRYTKDPVSNS